VAQKQGRRRHASDRRPATGATLGVRRDEIFIKMARSLSQQAMATF
jgi:hypothetical protein